ncbi:hypothetical protein [Methanogenium sp. MK-MG]|uniref:hypothetical protein n=1 Tax=Methanogenium sp. MK-MG TaxID=2599926 RepID=UPI0013ED6359|nr:hypothetical protein [Methanogenium sp. MK-MG]KAF1078839.1 hypothetical protein MKMG_00258 [Methanogenium sp. MK-MG]
MKILDKRSVYDVSGAAVSLADLIKTGNEGEIFCIDSNPGYCARIFHENHLTATLFQKITAMVANPPDAGIINHREKHGSVVLAWPVSVLFDSPLGSRNFIGYSMPLVDTGLFREAHCYYDPQECSREFGGAFSWRYLLTAVYNIATITDDIHRHGHCVGDFSGSNILIAHTAAVAVIDCESFQIRDSASGRVFPSVAGTGEYLPPELQGVDFAEEHPDRYYSDRFGLAVMIFRLLMRGVHPFQAEGEDVSALPYIEQKIQNGVFAFASPDNSIHPPSFAPDYHIIPPSLRRLFSRCFVDGITEPNRRPSAGEWKDCLLSEILAMKHCRVNANHWFGGHLAACPWCNGGQEIVPALSSVSPPSLSSPLCVPDETYDATAHRVPESDVGVTDTPANHSAILLPEPHLTMHDVARGITIPCRLPVTVTGDGPLLIHVTSDVPWIEIANAAVPVEGEGGVHVTLNTGNMSSNGFQKGRVLLSAGDIREEIFLFVSVLPEF